MSDLKPPEKQMYNKPELIGISAEERLKDFVNLGILQPLSAQSVANEVTYVNPDLDYSGLDFKVGRVSNIVYQVALGKSRKTPDRIVYARPGTSFLLRAVLLSGNSDITDKNGTRYRYLDVKGTGNIDVVDRQRPSVKESRYSRFLRPIPNYPAGAYSEKTWGQATKSWIEIDIRMMKKFQELGIKTIPIPSAVRLDEVLDKDGNKISIEEARKQGYINSATEPYQVFRAYVTPFRLHEIAYNPEFEYQMGLDTTQKDIEVKRAVLRSAMEDVGIESVEGYLEWLASEVGLGLGTMHKNGIGHGYLGGLHNITLDGRFMDLDSVIMSKGENHQIEVDRDGILNPHAGFVKGIFRGVPKLFGLDIDPKHLLDITLSQYHKNKAI